MADRHRHDRGSLPLRHRRQIRNHRRQMVPRRRRSHPQTPRPSRQRRPRRLHGLLQETLPQRDPPDPLRPGQHRRPRPRRMTGASRNDTLLKNAHPTMGDGSVLTCEDTVKKLLKSKRRWEIRSAGKGSKGDRWYAWAWIGTKSSRHSVLIRRHLKTGELAFHYCYIPEGQIRAKARLIRAAGLRWPVEEEFEFAKARSGLDQSQVRLSHAIARHTVLACAALAICAVTAALLRDRTDTQAGSTAPADQRPPAPPPPPPPRRGPRAPGEPGAGGPRRPQARARWFHKRTRLGRDATIS